MKIIPPTCLASQRRAFFAPLVIAAALFVATIAAHAATLYITLGGASVSKVGEAGGAVSSFVTLATNSVPQGLAFDTAGNLYAGEQNTRDIKKITPGGAVSLFATMPTGSAPTGLAFDTAGSLFVANANSSLIMKVTPAGVVSTFADMGPVTTPVGLAFDTGGNLYFADVTGDEIRKVTPGGVSSLYANLPASSLAQGLAFDSGGTLYVARDNANVISKVSATGVVTTFATTTGGARFLAFAPVPEPATAAAPARRRCAHRTPTSFAPVAVRQTLLSASDGADKLVRITPAAAVRRSVRSA